jgi:hypothetical protein
LEKTIEQFCIRQLGEALTYTETLRWFDENWPADLTWPEAVPRKLVKAITAKRSAA